jgi:hypothetical protein
MPIPVACKCGQKFAAKDELAGKVTKCPKCGSVLQIPQPGKPSPPPSKQGSPQASGSQGKRTAKAGPAVSSLADLLDEAGVKPGLEDTRPRCPACKQPMDPNAVLCVSCGFHVQTGKQLRGVGGAGGPGEENYGLSDDGGHGAVAKGALRKAERAIKEEKVEEFKTRTQGVPVWALAVAFFSLVTFGIGMSLLPTELALLITGSVLSLSSGLAGFVYAVLILVIAFQENIKEGLCTLLVPFYFFYYSISRWKACRNYFTIWLICQVVGVLGWGIVALAPSFHQAEEQKQHSR